MKTRSLSTLAPATALALILFGAGAAVARDGATNDAQAIANAKVSIAQAIDAAEKATGGKATEAGVEDENGAVIFEVTVVANGAEQKVLVDTQTGKVLKTAAADSELSGEKGENEEGGENDAD